MSVATVFLYSLTRNPLRRNPPLVRPCEYLTDTAAPPIQTDLLRSDEFAVTITPARLGVHQAHTSFEPSPARKANGSPGTLLGTPELVQFRINAVAQETVSAGQAESSPITTIGVSSGALQVRMSDRLPDASRLTVHPDRRTTQLLKLANTMHGSPGKDAGKTVLYSQPVIHPTTLTNPRLAS